MARSRSDKAILAAFGSYVRKLRKGQGWTQEVLAEHAGLNSKYVGGIERGERNPAVLVVNKLSGALGDDLSGFFPFGVGAARRR
jgi:transcriptional regulator with XRE-family HTH domain